MKSEIPGWNSFSKGALIPLKLGLIIPPISHHAKKEVVDPSD